MLLLKHTLLIMRRVTVVCDKMRDVTVERQQGRKLAATGTRKSKGPTGLYEGCTKAVRRLCEGGRVG
jgi:hypothetical protein